MSIYDSTASEFDVKHLIQLPPSFDDKQYEEYLSVKCCLDSLKPKRLLQSIAERGSSTQKHSAYWFTQ